MIETIKNCPDCKKEAMEEMECWHTQEHLKSCNKCELNLLAKRLLVARTEERNNDFRQYGEYRYAPHTLEDIKKELHS
jgi:hypothetical protein